MHKIKSRPSFSFLNILFYLEMHYIMEVNCFYLILFHVDFNL